MRILGKLKNLIRRSKPISKPEKEVSEKKAAVKKVIVKKLVKRIMKKPAIKKAQIKVRKAKKVKMPVKHFKKPKSKIKVTGKRPKLKAAKKEKIKKVVYQKPHELPPNLKLTNKAIEDLAINLAGDDTPPLITLLKDKKNVSEFKLADQLNLTVNQVRNMLYRLYKHSLVTFIRKKDKKKGWYVYYWTLDIENLKEELLNFKKAKLEEFKQRLENEQSGVYFVCPNACMRLKYEHAMEYDFKCQECGQLLHQQDNSRTVSNIKANIKEIEEELSVKEEEKPKE